MDFIRVEETKEERIAADILNLFKGQKVSIEEALTILEDIKKEIMKTPLR